MFVHWLVTVFVSLHLVLAPIAQAKTEAPAPVTINAESLDAFDAVDAQNRIYEILSGYGKLPPTKESLAEKAKVSGNFVLQEVLQLTSTLIILGTVAFKAASDRQELIRLSSGTYEFPKDDPNANYCSQAPGTRAKEDLLCSGEFLVGFLASIGVALPSAAVKILLWWLGKKGYKLALLNVVVGVFSAALMMSLAQASSMLWTQAVKYLGEERLIKQAHGLMGRYVIAWSTGKSEQFKNSADGVLLSSITSIMYSIVMVNHTLRMQWLTNLWRFGFARGEFISSIAILIGSSAAAEAAVVGAGLLITLGWTAPVLVIVLSVTFGVGGMTFAFDHEIPQTITRIIQDIRQATHTWRLGRNSNTLDILTERFMIDRYRDANAGNPVHINNVRPAVLSYLQGRSNIRNNIADIAIEKLVELRLESDMLEQKIQIAEKVINSADLQKKIYYNDNGKLLSAEEAMKKVCAEELDEASKAYFGSTKEERAARISRKKCVPLHDQLTDIPKFRRLISEARDEMHELSVFFAEFYAKDESTLCSFTTNENIILPPVIAEDFSKFRMVTADARRSMMGVLAFLDHKLFATWKMPFPEALKEEKVRTAYEQKAREVLDAYYAAGFDELVTHEVAEKRRQANGQPVPPPSVAECTRYH